MSSERKKKPIVFADIDICSDSISLEELETRTQILWRTSYLHTHRISVATSKHVRSKSLGSCGAPETHETTKAYV